MVIMRSVFSLARVAAAALLAVQSVGAQGVFHGHKGQTTARVPRLDAEVVIDGSLDEPAWKLAALLTGFSAYLPLDNRPAADSTEVLLWFTPTDLYFGVRAFEEHGAVHATLAARDHADSDDNVLFPEKRPFFVDGSDKFETPNNLIYTRRIVQPDAAVKMSGKFGRSNVALLSAMDGQLSSASGKEHPLFNLLRVRRDILGASTVGLTLTDRTEGSDFNRVASTDTRLVWKRAYALSAQGSFSSTRTGATTHNSPQWDISHIRQGLRVGYLYSFAGFDPNFRAQSGFVPRTDFVRTQVYNRFSFYGKPGSLIESYLVRQGADWLWLYDGFTNGDGVQETKLQVENVLNLRGGWIISMTPVTESFRFDPRSDASYRTLRPPGGRPPSEDTVAFTPGDRVSTAEVLLRVTTPQYQLFSGRFSSIIGRDVNFFETAPAHRTDLTADVDLRPSAKLRLTTSYLYSVYTRWQDNTTFSTANVPRLKVEYQISRPLCASSGSTTAVRATRSGIHGPNSRSSSPGTDTPRWRPRPRRTTCASTGWSPLCQIRERSSLPATGRH